jgi:hypothetical protein
MVEQSPSRLREQQGHDRERNLRTDRARVMQLILADRLYKMQEHGIAKQSEDGTFYLLVQWESS